MWTSFVEHYKWFGVGFVIGMIPVAGWWIWCLAYLAWSKRRSRSQRPDLSSSPGGQSSPLGLDPDGFPLPESLPSPSPSPPSAIPGHTANSAAPLCSLCARQGWWQISITNCSIHTASQRASYERWAALGLPPAWGQPATTPNHPLYVVPVRMKSAASAPPPKYVYGFRGWYLDVGPGAKRWDVTGKTVVEPGAMHLLPSNSKYGEWLPGANAAVCRRSLATDPPHRAGASGCSCGFWCLHDLAHVGNNISRPGDEFLGNGTTVWGSIVGWGQCTRQGTGGYGSGWRCEHAQVLAFMDPFARSQPAPDYADAHCPHCGQWEIGITVADPDSHNRSTIEHRCGVAGGPNRIYIDAPTITSAVNDNRHKYLGLLKILSQRFDVPVVPEAELEAFTKATVEGMYKQYDSDSDSV
jgi:hypothetical protein